MTRKRYALVGTGGRGRMFVDAIAGPYRENAQLVALCDLSQKRMDWYNAHLAETYDYPALPTYRAADFDRMVAETKPDTVIVTTMDSTHHIYITRAMELGCDAITEKPMTTDADKAKAIFDAIDRTGRNLRVTFNYRYAPIATTARDLILQGAVGRPLHVNFQWVLDTSHGADYFRRWHREKDKSGGLLVHKATHHFDLINWWIDSYPQQVFAMGDLLFYGRENAAARGESYDYDRYTRQPRAANDPFALRLDENDTLRALYLDVEDETGYIRDRNVFGDNISAEDTMSVTARYRNGVLLTYSLLAYSPWEGYRVAVTGDRGRMEVELVESVGKQFVAGQEETPEGREALQEQIKAEFGGMHIRIFPMFGKPYEVEIPQATGGGHGGADPVMLEQIFAPDPPADPYNRAASHIDGAASILLGIAANESIATGRMIEVDDLLTLP
jgi:predicted dehydrogenase